MAQEETAGNGWLARVRRRRTTRWLWRLGVTVVGAAVVLAGVAMLVLPGPGWAAVFLGLAILATEYAWAHATLARAKGYAKAATDKALDPASRRRNLAIGGVIGSLLVAGGLWYLAAYGWSFDGPTSWFAW